MILSDERTISERGIIWNEWKQSNKKMEMYLEQRCERQATTPKWENQFEWNSDWQKYLPTKAFANDYKNID